MDWDHCAEEQSQRLFASWLRILLGASPALALKLAKKHRPDQEPTEASSLITGAFNICSIVTFEDGFKVIVRFPILGRSRFRVEKTNDELLVMAYLTPRTKIPIPQILGTGMWACGPYTVSTFVEGTLLSKCLPNPGSGVSSPELSRAYRAMADIMLELYKLPFPRIGAIGHEVDQWKVAKRPLTLNMNELVRVGNYPPSEFAQPSFQTASEYFEELARQQYLHLKYQRNDAFLDRYRPRLELFLREMKACEDERICAGTLEESERLSEPMAQSMANGMFWFCLAVRKSFMFDDIYWTFLDEKFYGPLGVLEDRLSLLSDEEKSGLDGFVKSKMQQSSECCLDEHLTLDEVMEL
ncbi:hypothetical protein HRG_001291 [Hirsutella rhossiliensis]|uniref:Phosphotransferase enzyme family protein n=1 Tax=Hirsutella rhossiliensis TaxID=111463 RepID=A0A9P8N8F5_9HYPO|nr:uncharacterized protein HRG_01291 [Hirsutella rhossiliensis]KAH0968649.1 hypothetical protein HRG_01291 [Hirsutella rhossiliensis]